MPVAPDWVPLKVMVTVICSLQSLRVVSVISDLPVSGQCWARVCLVSTDLCGLSVSRPRRWTRCSVARALCCPPDTTCPS